MKADIKFLAVIILAAVTLTQTTLADLGDQLFKLLPEDGDAIDEFGYSVAISGSIAIIGAWRDDNNSNQSGSAYLFDTTTGQQLFRLLPEDPSAEDRFGNSVAISGNTAIVGVEKDSDNGASSGSAYLFDTNTGKQLFKLIASDAAAGDRFGKSVAISGSIAIVGAFGSGSAYLFDISDPANPIELAKLLPDDGLEWFGYSVAISGTTAVVSNYVSSSAYLFDLSDPANPIQIAKLLADDGVEDDQFGRSVSINGTTAIVGAMRDDDNGTNSGSAYLFDITSGKQIAKLLPADGAAGDYFGWGIGINGSIAIIGAYRNDDNGDSSGSAYLFDISDPANPVQLIKLLPHDGAGGDSFGRAVGISGSIAIAAAAQDGDNGEASGSAYLFDASAFGKCPWDLDSSGSVGTSDLLALFAQWGTAGAADFDGSGAVGTSDLLILFANWGPCE